MMHFLPSSPRPTTVIPAKAGISGEGAGKKPHEIPAFAGMTGIFAGMTGVAA